MLLIFLVSFSSFRPFLLIAYKPPRHPQIWARIRRPDYERNKENIWYFKLSNLIIFYQTHIILYRCFFKQKILFNVQVGSLFPRAIPFPLILKAKSISFNFQQKRWNINILQKIQAIVVVIQKFGSYCIIPYFIYFLNFLILFFFSKKGIT